MELSNFHLLVLVLISTCFGNSFSRSSGDTTDSTSIKELLSDDKTSLMTTCEDKHPQNVSLDLSYLGLPRIKDFISNPHVTCLNLEGNDIEEGNLRAFEGLSNLAYLNLANNKIDLVDFLDHGSHKNLKTLILDNAGPKRTEENMDHYHYNGGVPINNYYNGGSGIQNIKISANLPNLKNLYLRNISKGRISSFSIANLPNLTHLYLSDNNFQDGIYAFLENMPPALTHLYLERCNIMLTRISNLSTSLISLSLDGNIFSCFDDGCMNFRNFPRLKFLSVANTSISFVPLSALDSNSDLLYLDMSQNLIQDLPEGAFNKLSKLEVLNLSSNQFSEIPNLCSLKKLRNLDISFNGIKHIYTHYFNCVEDIKSLNMCGNEISSIPAGTFDNLRNLVTLDLSRNKLSKLEYRSSSNLKYLLLNYNLFQSVEYVLLGKTSLVLLNLDNNPINTIKPLSLKSLPENTTIFINERFS